MLNNAQKRKGDGAKSCVVKTCETLRLTLCSACGFSLSADIPKPCQKTIASIPKMVESYLSYNNTDAASIVAKKP